MRSLLPFAPARPESAPEREGRRRRYSAPAILFRQPLEAIAAVCPSGPLPLNGKQSAVCSFTQS